MEEKFLTSEEERHEEEHSLSKHSQNTSSDFRSKLLEMEGECKIKSISLLKLNYPKAILFGFLLSLSIIGLLFLKYFKSLRAWAFYSSLNQNQIAQVTHIFVVGQQKTEQICEVQIVLAGKSEKIIFRFKQLRYELLQNSWVPLGLPYLQDLSFYQSQNFLNKGLSTKQANLRQNLYGLNQHKVEVPAYLQYVFDTMTQPLYLFQYFVSLIYALQSFLMFAVLMIFFGFLTTTVNYILLRRSYKKIKDTAQKQFKVRVLRDGEFVDINNIELVPGDIYIPSEEIPCDSIVIRGELFVDEVSLTGQNVPIAKFRLIDSEKIHDKSHWLFEGSKLQTMKEKTLALVINVGYGSRRGRIIRHILTKIAKQPQFFKKIIYFQVEVLLVSIVVFLVTLPRMFQFDIDPIMKILRLCDFITYSFPAPYPILFNLAYSFCLVRLNKVEIIGTEAEKTVEGSRLKTICFDKTGTLTQNKMQVASVYRFKSAAAVEEVTTRVNEFQPIANLFASCNSVELIGREVKGDEIDLRLFEYVSSRLQESHSAGVVREVRVHGRTLEVLKINQYESQFQSMSVLVRDPQSGRHTVFAKGSPEMIHNYSLFKLKGFEDFVKKLSFGGFRSIGFSCKEVSEAEAQRLMAAGREDFLRETEMVGVVTFVNKLKEDAASTIAALNAADISTKIITGDNIFLGVQTAFATGMITPDKRVIVVEGSKYDRKTGATELLQLTRNPAGEISERRIKVESFSFSNRNEQVYAVDNDFIKFNPQTFLSDQVKVFARISPENKALIVKVHRQRQQTIVNQRKGVQKLFGDCSFKIGMVGDGANDLIAIKEADVGIGISSSDAIYSAAFAIKDLSQIVHIILQSKNTQRQINEMAKYYGITQFLSIVITVILTQDCSYFTTIQLLYKNFVNTLLITVFFGMCKPYQKLKKFIPNSNFLDLENHLIFWTNLIIFGVGLVASYLYYSNTDDFVPNNTHRYVHFEDGWYGNTKSSTMNFIAANLSYIALALFIYKSKPWKQPVWTNKPLFGVILVNTVLIIIISFITDKLSDLQFQPIAIKQVLIVYAIMLLTCVVCAAVNLILDKLCFRSRYTENSQLSEGVTLHDYN